MAGDIKLKYAASSTPTVTSLQSLASSQDWTAGWTMAAIDNTTDCYDDYLFGFKFTTNASNRQAGQIKVYVISALNDTPTWPAASSGTPGTQGALSFTDIEERDSCCRELISITVDNTASAVYDVGQIGIAHLFGGKVPSDFTIYIAQNCSTTTTAGLASSGNAVYYTGVYGQYT